MALVKNLNAQKCSDHFDILKLVNMSEIDNLEGLSNADLRKKCIAHGLPNVPITDSSRNVLIKKLRASLSGAPASSPKKTQRRETIHITKIKEVAETKEDAKVEPERRTPSRGAGRRTIAGTPTFESQKSNEIKVADSIAPAPVSTRRRSSVRELEIPQSQKEKPIKNFNPVVILESDEEDNDLLIAAEQAEQNTKPQPFVQNEPSVRSRSSRSVSLSKTGVVTTSYNQGVAKPLAEVPEVPTRNLLTENVSRDVYKPPINISNNRYSLHSNFVQTQTSTGANKLTTSLPFRYSTNTLPASFYSSKVTPSYNEQSDEDAEQQDFETPFLSSFARNLERIKTDGVSLGKSSIDMQSPRLTHRSKRFEITGRRPANDSVTESFRQFLIALDRKYNLRLYLVLATIFLVLAFLYVVLYQ